MRYKIIFLTYYRDTETRWDIWVSKASHRKSLTFLWVITKLGIDSLVPKACTSEGLGNQGRNRARSFECCFLGSGDFEVPIGFNTLGNHMETSCLYPVSVVSKVIVRDLVYGKIILL